MTNFYPEGSTRRTGVLRRPYTVAQLYQAMVQGRILEAPVTLCDSELNLHVQLGEGLYGIIPRAEAAYTLPEAETKDIAILTRVGKSVCFRVTDVIEGNEPRFILSRRAAQKECYTRYIASLSPGDVIAARVTHLESFGAFLDVGCGIVALLTVDALSVSRISHPKYRLTCGEEIQVVVRSIDENGRIYVSRKELLGTWEENAALFSPGQTVPGVIRGVEDYGVFVELTPNLAGLAEARTDVAENRAAIVYIKSIIPEKMKIKLVIIDSAARALHAAPMPTVVKEGISHMDRWRYSPEGSVKLVETVFLP